MTLEELLEAVEGDALERLRWRVLTGFGVLPGSAQAGELSDADVLLCGAHMLLDRRLRFAASGGRERAVNTAFDKGRFLALSEEEK